MFQRSKKIVAFPITFQLHFNFRLFGLFVKTGEIIGELVFLNIFIYSYLLHAMQRTCLRFPNPACETLSIGYYPLQVFYMSRKTYFHNSFLNLVKLSLFYLNFLFWKYKYTYFGWHSHNEFFSSCSLGIKCLYFSSL